MLTPHEAMIVELGNLPTPAVRAILARGGPTALANRIRPTIGNVDRDLTPDLGSTAGLFQKLSPQEAKQVIRAADLLEKGAGQMLIQAIQPLMPTAPNRPATTPSS